MLPMKDPSATMLVDSDVEALSTPAVAFANAIMSAGADRPSAAYLAIASVTVALTRRISDSVSRDAPPMSAIAFVVRTASEMVFRPL
jgi:hypothetical protein